VSPNNPCAQDAYVYLFYIDKDGAVNDRFPTAQVALNFRDHDWTPYSAALSGIARAQA